MSDTYEIIMHVHWVQRWFLKHRGVPMIKKPCAPCGGERIFTIWTDGMYYCLPCLYRQAERRSSEDRPLLTATATMESFSSSWLAYVARIETLEEPWKPSASAVIRLTKISRLRPPPVCEVEACATCAGYRPFMRREDGDAGCIFCLMQGRIVEIEIEVTEEHAAA
jgi:hypothetical protein